MIEFFCENNGFYLKKKGGGRGGESSLRMKYNFSKNQVLTRHFMILLAVL